MPKPLQLLRDRYQLQKILGQNAGRQTWLALDTQSQNQVVVKLLTFSDRVQWDQVRLFEREAKILKHLDHLQIPQYRDFFCLDDQQLWYGLVQSYTAVLVCVKYSELPRRKALSNPCVTHSAENRCIPALSLKQRLEPIRKLQ